MTGAVCGEVSSFRSRMGSKPSRLGLQPPPPPFTGCYGYGNKVAPDKPLQPTALVI
jgi:hypothetical protein